MPYSLEVLLDEFLMPIYQHIISLQEQQPANNNKDNNQHTRVQIGHTYPNLIVASTTGLMQRTFPIFSQRFSLGELHRGPDGVDERFFVERVRGVVDVDEGRVSGRGGSEGDGAVGLGVHVHDEGA